jgi:DNA end-binding protein Ku
VEVVGMARAIWSGSLSFGLVNVPVGLFSATEDKTIHFHQFEKGTSSRIRYKRVNEDTGEEVDYDDIVKGADVGDGKFVTLTPEELEAVEPGRSRTIDIADFVDVADIDPIFYQKTYYLAPKDEPAQRAYSLLLRAMDEAQRVGIATFVMRSKQYLAAVRPQGDVLTLETMFFADEVRDPASELEQLPGKVKLKTRDVDMAVSLIESMTTEWNPSNYHDTYRERVEELIEAKKDDEEVVTTQPESDEGQVLDLMDALQASLDRARGHRPGNAKGAGELKRGRSKGSVKGNGEDGVTTASELGDLSKSELYDLATELDVPGRSSMTKAELAKAVAKAQGGGATRRGGRKKAS